MDDHLCERNFHWSPDLNSVFATTNPRPSPFYQELVAWPSHRSEIQGLNATSSLLRGDFRAPLLHLDNFIHTFTRIFYGIIQLHALSYAFLSLKTD